MASVSASDWINVMNLSDMTATNAEYILDLAIDLLNIYGASLSNMNGGAAGSKTVTLTSKQRGGVFLVARVVYYSFYQGVEPATIAGMTVGVADLMAVPQVMRTVEHVAQRLESDSYDRIPFVAATDESGLT